MSEEGVTKAVVTNVFSVEYAYKHQPSFCSQVGLLLVPLNKDEPPYLCIFLATRLDMILNIKPNREKHLQQLTCQRSFRARADEFIHKQFYPIGRLVNLEKRTLRDREELAAGKRKREEHEREEREREEAEGAAAKRTESIKRKRAKAGRQIQTSPTTIEWQCLLLTSPPRPPQPWGESCSFDSCAAPPQWGHDLQGSGGGLRSRYDGGSGGGSGGGGGGCGASHCTVAAAAAQRRPDFPADPRPGEAPEFPQHWARPCGANRQHSDGSTVHRGVPARRGD